MEDSEFGPIFFAEVEHGNRSMPELIRHLGVLLVNFPNLNGVLGTTGEEGRQGKMNALVLIEWRTVAGQRGPHVTQLIDFGPNPYTDLKRGNINTTLALPPTPAATPAEPGQHGAGVVALPDWTRFANGMDGDNEAIVPLSPALLLTRARQYGTGAVINVPATALPARINLADLVRKYRR